MNVVVGATGLVGGEVCRLLAESGQPVRALVRSTLAANGIARLRDLGVEILQGDLKDRDAIDAVCRNAEAVISTASSTLRRQEGDSIDSVDRHGQLNLVDAAERAGVGRFVYVSFPPIELDFPLQTAKRAVERRLAASRMTFTILQPTCFMEIWLSPAVGFDPARGSVSVCGIGESRVSWISYLDVARFAVAALRNPGAANATLKLGGPDALSPLEVVRMAEQLAMKPTAIQRVPDDVLRSQYEAASDPLQRSMAALMIYVARGEVIDMTQALRDFSIPRLKAVREHLRDMMTGLTMGVRSMLPGS